jgi:DNA-directed RNA polymerase alpha subunit
MGNLPPHVENLTVHDALFDIDLREPIGIGVRAYNGLARMGITDLETLVSLTEKQLLDIPNFGKTSLQEVKEALQARGLSLKGKK